MKLKIYTDKQYLAHNQKHVSFLNPYWGDLDSHDDVDFGRFTYYNEHGKELFEIVPLENAQIVICPGEWNAENPRIIDLYKIAVERNLPFILFFNNDSSEVIPLEKAIVYRTSFYRSKKRNNDFAIPGWSIDFLEKYYDGKLLIRKKGPLPKISYTGYIDFDNPIGQINFWLKKRICKNRNGLIGAELRGKAIRVIQKNKLLNSSFVIRNGFLGGCGEDLRREYMKNMLDSDYVIVARGAGNFSYRFYEVLSSGRIPVFIDTDCVLPFEDAIRWKDYCVWVDRSQIKRIGQIVVDFHNKISCEDFITLQKRIRHLYEEWIKPYSFYEKMLKQIEDKVLSQGDTK